MMKMIALKQSFALDFKTLSIKENGVEVFKRDGVKLVSMNFPDDKTVVLKPYEIILECYDLKKTETSIASMHGVIDPSVNIEYSESEDGTLNIDVSGSAKGVYNSATGSSDLLKNAADYVQARVRDTVSPLPILVEGYSSGKLLLMSENETVNRLESSYSLTRRYQMSRVGTSPILFKHTLDLSYNEESGVYTVNFNGDVSGGMNTTIGDLRTAVGQVDAYAISASFLMTAGLSPSAPEGLNPNPLSVSINEEERDKRISFSYSYNSDTSANVYFEYDTSVKYSELDSVWSVSVGGSVRGKSSQTNNWEPVKNYANGVNLRNICLAALTEEGFTGVLEDEPMSYSRTDNERESTVQLRAEYKQKKHKMVLTTLNNLSYTISITRPLYEKKPIHTWNNGLKMLDINCLKRGMVSISGTGEDKNFCDSPAVRDQIVSFMKSELIKYAGTSQFLEDVKVTESKGEGVKKYSFSASMSFENKWVYDNK